MDEEDPLLQDPLLRTVASQLANETRARPSDHPSGATIHRYVAGELDAERQSELQAHLSVCGRCTQEFLELRDFLSTPVTDDDLQDAVEVWPRLRSRLVQEGILTASTTDSRAEAGLAGRRARLPVQLSWALAASTALLLATTIYLALQLRTARHPQANVLIADLVPTSEAPIVRGGGAGEEIVIPHEVDRLLLVLNAPAAEPSARYRLEIRDATAAGGALRWASARRSPTRSANFNLDLPRDFLPDGSYSLRIVDVGGATPVLVADYHLRIRHEQ